MKLNVLTWPGAVNDASAPPPGPVAAWKSILCGTVESERLANSNSTVSPSRTRIIGPGTWPPNVQNLYSTPSAMRITFSCTSNFTLTRAAWLRFTGGGASGANVVTPSITGKSAAATSASEEAATGAGEEDAVAAVSLAGAVFSGAGCFGAEVCGCWQAARANTEAHNAAIV